MNIFKGILLFEATNITKTNKYLLGFFHLPRMCARDWCTSVKGLLREVICFCNARGLKKRVPLKLCSLSCFVWFRSVLFNPYCVSNLFFFFLFFSERRQSTLSFFRTESLSISVSFFFSFTPFLYWFIRWWNVKGNNKFRVSWAGESFVRT